MTTTPNAPSEHELRTRATALHEAAVLFSGALDASRAGQPRAVVDLMLACAEDFETWLVRPARDDEVAADQSDADVAPLTQEQLESIGVLVDSNGLVRAAGIAKALRALKRHGYDLGLA